MKIGQLKYVKVEDRFYIDDVELHCGDCFQVLIYNGLTDNIDWIDTRIEKYKDWYLCDIVGYQLSGLFAKIN